MQASYHVREGDVPVPSGVLLAELGGGHGRQGDIVDRRGLDLEDALFLPFLQSSAPDPATMKL